MNFFILTINDGIQSCVCAFAQCLLSIQRQLITVVGSYKQFQSMSQANARAQVPGYCGYIPGKNSQNKFGSTFGQITKGSYTTQQEAFLTTNIHNNQFIKQQYSGDHNFWGNEGKLNAFNQSTQEPIKHNKRIDAPKFVPEKVTNLTYEEATSKASKKI